MHTYIHTYKKEKETLIPQLGVRTLDFAIYFPNSLFLRIFPFQLRFVKNVSNVSQRFHTYVNQTDVLRDSLSVLCEVFKEHGPIHCQPIACVKMRTPEATCLPGDTMHFSSFSVQIILHSKDGQDCNRRHITRVSTKTLNTLNGIP